MDKNERFIEACKSDDVYNAIILMEDPDVDVNYRDKDGATALCYAVYNGYIGIVKRLLNHRFIYINLKYNGMSPLHIASNEGNVELVQLLLSKGANIDFDVDALDPNIHEIVKIKSILNRWPLSMGVLGLQANAVYPDGNIVEELNDFIGGRKRNKKSNKRRKTIRKKRKTFKRK